MEPRSTRDIEILFKSIVKVPVLGNTADTPNSSGSTIGFYLDCLNYNVFSQL